MKRLVVLLALCGCSSGMSGTLAFATNTELAGGPLTDGGVAIDLDVVLASVDQGPTSCAGLLNPALTARILVIRLLAAGEGIAFVVPGTYPLEIPDDAGMAQLSLYTVDDAGQNPIATGLSGSVTLTQITPTTTGSFNATMALADGGSGGDLSGSFNATFCGR